MKIPGRSRVIFCHCDSYDAEKICGIGGFDRSLIETVSMGDLRRQAPRPVSSKLACIFSEKLGLKPMPDWEEALARFVKERNGNK